MKRLFSFLLIPIFLFVFNCSDSKKETDQKPVVPEEDFYSILLQVFNGIGKLPEGFAAVLDDSFSPRGIPPLRSFENLDTGLGSLWLFASTVSDNGISIIKPGMRGTLVYEVPGSDLPMRLEVEQFLMNVAIHTKAVMAVIEDDPASEIKGVLPDGMTINIVVDGVPYSINREWIRQNSYFSAYVLLAKARVIDVRPKENQYPIPETYSFSRFEIFTYDNEGNVVGSFTKASDLLHAISNLTYENPTLTYQLKVEVSTKADLSQSGSFGDRILLPYSIYGKADITFPLLYNYTVRGPYTGDPRKDEGGCHFTDPSWESVDGDTEYYPQGASTWWLPNISQAQINFIRNNVSQDGADMLERLLYIDEGERGFDVDWWRDLEILTIVPGLGLSDVGVFDRYSGSLGSEDLAGFNVNGVMDSAENRAVFFDRVFRMNGFRLTDMGNIPEEWEMPYPDDLPEGIMDSVKIDIDAQGNVTFGGKYDGPTRIVGLYSLADSIPPELKVFFYQNGLVPADTQYDPAGLSGYSNFVKNVRVYLPCASYEGGWQEVNMFQLLQYIASKWQKGKQAFYADFFADVENPDLAEEILPWLAQLTATDGNPLGAFPRVDKGELAMPLAPFIIRADITVPAHEKTYGGLEIISSAFGGFYNTNFYRGATAGSGLGK